MYRRVHTYTVNDCTTATRSHTHSQSRSREVGEKPGKCRAKACVTTSRQWSFRSAQNSTRSVSRSVYSVYSTTKASWYMVNGIVSRGVYTYCVHVGSETHVPAAAAALAAVKLSTSSMSTHMRESPSATSSWMKANNFITSFPLSENHFENRLCALISSKCPPRYLAGGRRKEEGDI